MNMQRWLRSAPIAALLVAGASRLAMAQGTQLLEWSGNVDREVQVVMRGSQIWTNKIGSTEAPHARTRIFSAVPRQDGQVVAQLEGGRGNVDVIQQPSRSNNYTTILRITDPRGGAASYRVAAYWQAYSNGDVYDRRGVYGNGNGNGNANGRMRDRDRDGIPDRDERGTGRYGQGQQLMHWTGNVDGLLEIRIQNGRVSYRNLGGSNPSNIRADASNLGNVVGNVNVSVSSGRGQVQIVQQPQQWNSYTTIIRVNDPQSGASYYDFSLFAQ